jgi:hypothetical protein
MSIGMKRLIRVYPGLSGARFTTQNTPMTNKSVAQICALAAVVIMPSLSWAGTTTKSTGAATPAPAPEKLNESAITGDIGLNVVTAYYFRGAIQNNHSPSFQPYADIFLKAYEGDGFLNKAVFGLGVWESYTNAATEGRNSKRPNSYTGTSYKQGSSSNSTWYESDITPSIALTFGKVTITETYLFYSSPNNQFTSNQGLSSKIGYDDGDLLGAFALHPTFTLIHETDGKEALIDNTTQTTSKHGNYWEIAAAPSYSAGPVTLTLPLTAGFGSQSYYAKNGFGYFSAGLNAAYALPIAKTYGTWTANAGATYYSLDKNVVGGNASDDFVGQIGLGVAF